MDAASDGGAKKAEAAPKAKAADKGESEKAPAKRAAKKTKKDDE